MVINTQTTCAMVWKTAWVPFAKKASSTPVLQLRDVIIIDTCLVGYSIPNWITQLIDFAHPQSTVLPWQLIQCLMIKLFRRVVSQSTNSDSRRYLRRTWCRIRIQSTPLYNLDALFFQDKYMPELQKANWDPSTRFAKTHQGWSLSDLLLY